MTQRVNDVHQLAQKYFDVVYRGDLEAFDNVFSANCELQTLADGKQKVLPLSEYRELVITRELSHRNQDGVIEETHVTDKIGCLRVKVQIGGTYFTDYLSVMQLADGWKIVAKVFLKT